jgi:hypothetical protein
LKILFLAAVDMGYGRFFAEPSMNGFYGRFIPMMVHFSVSLAINLPGAGDAIPTKK